MVNVLTTLCRYILIFLIVIYTFSSFHALRNIDEDRKAGIYGVGVFLIFSVHLTGFLVAFANLKNMQVAILYGCELLYFVLTLSIYPAIYRRLNRGLLNNMCMFLAISDVILCRLSFDKAVKQFSIVAAATLLTAVVPWLVKRFRGLYKLKWVFGALGIALLGVVLLSGVVTLGAKLSISIGGISIQPSEFVKVIFIFFIASFLWNAPTFKTVVAATCFGAGFVMILVLSTDLGSALIFFVVYMFMLYVSTKKIWYLLAGFGAGSGAAVVAYYLFYHIRVRIAAWQDPWSIINGGGYQIAQSLFAIGAGGWMGVGLFKGMPNAVPLVVKDFIFAAISEELGGIVSIMVILLCLCTFMIFLKIGTKQPDNFHKLLAVGFGVAYAFQVFLTVGAAMNMIPLTGVTLPLVSYGGSSALSTIFIFSIVQGLNLIVEEERQIYEEREQASRDGLRQYGSGAY